MSSFVLARVRVGVASAVVAGALVVLAGCGASGPSAPAAELFASRCASCHGPAGQGGGMAPPIVDAVARLGADGVAGVVTGGRVGMPAFGSLLSDADVDALVAYLATFDD